MDVSRSSARAGRQQGEAGPLRCESGADGRQRAANVLLCCAPDCGQDLALMHRLMEHLGLLLRDGRIRAWHDGLVVPGTDREADLFQRLEDAQVILLLLSSTFIASDKCYKRLAARAMERHEAGIAKVIPVVLRACDWRSGPFGALAPLPADGTPIAQAEDVDNALTEVVKGLRAALDAMNAGPRSASARERLAKGPADEHATAPIRGARGWRSVSIATVLALVVATSLVLSVFRERNEIGSAPPLPSEATSSGSVVAMSIDGPGAPTGAAPGEASANLVTASDARSDARVATADRPSVRAGSPAKGVVPPAARPGPRTQNEAPTTTSASVSGSAWTPLPTVQSPPASQNRSEGTQIGVIKTRDESPVSVKPGTTPTRVGRIETRDKSPVTIGGPGP